MKELTPEITLLTLELTILILWELTPELKELKELTLELTLEIRKLNS